jgi:subtilisin family serine protease
MLQLSRRCSSKSVRERRAARRAAPPIFQLEPVERRVLLASISGVLFNDYNGDGVKAANEPGLPNWTIFLDENQNGVFDGTSQSIPSTDTPMPIPDVRTPPTISLLNVSNVAQIAKLTVAIDITHTYNADLDVFLISPDGTRVELFTDIGGSGDGMNIILDDDAAASITTAPTTGVITGTWRPEGLLSSFIGQDPTGQWTLEITDDAAADSGTLNSWSLIFSTGERSITTGSTGNYQFLNVAAGTYDVRQVNQAGWNQTFPASGFHTLTLDASTNATNINFGNRQPPGTIRGIVFSDYNANGVRDPNEAGLSGWTVYLDTNDNGQLDGGEPTRLSAADGGYEFTNLIPGQHVVREVLKAGFVQTLPGSGGVNLRGGGDGSNGGGVGDGNGNAGGLDGSRKFTQTEIVVAFKGTIGKGALKKQVQADPALARQVNYGASADMFTTRGVTLVEVRLQPGADPQKVAHAFDSLGKVKWAQPNYIYDDIDPREFTPNDPQYNSQYHHALMKNNLAWDTTLGSPSILIGITDDGFLMNHPDLVDNYWVNPGEIPGDGIDNDGNGFIDDVNGWNFWNNNNNPNPASASNDHGTHVAGIAAARTNNGIGVAGTAGGSTIVPIRFYSTSGGTWTSTIVSNAYRYATDVGCNIVTTSYNVDGFSNDNIFANALNYMYDGGVLHFNSAGNTSAANPARQKWDHTLYVVNTDAADRKVSSSAWGWGVDVSAPGNSILSTSIGSTLNDPNYELKTGTSMASPNAAGVAALIWSANPTWTRDQVAAQLLGSADNIDALNPAHAGLLGSGRVNSFRALTETIAPPRVKSLAGLPAEGSTVLTKPNSFTLDLASVFSSATMNPAAFELRGAGLDGVFGTGDDQLIPMTLVFGGASAADYKIGTNRLFFTIPGSMGSDTYRFSLKATATDPFGQPLDGNGDGVGGDAFSRTFILTGPTNPYRVMIDPGEVVENVNFGNHDRVPPKVLGSQFAFATAQGLVVQFNEDVSGSLAVGDLALLNLTTNTPVATAGFTLTYDSATHTATFNVNGILPDGNYLATFSGTTITDLSGNKLDGNGDGVGGDDYSFNFFFLQGDANRDGTVNLDDFNILAANFGQSPRDFTQADFTYDGIVNLDDFNILASQFGTSLGSAASSGEAGQAPSPVVKGIGSASTGSLGIVSRGGSLGTSMFSQTQIGTLKAPGERQAHLVLLDEQTGRLLLA